MGLARAPRVEPAGADRQIVVATGEIFREVGRGIYKTVDGGASWNLCTTPAGLDPLYFMRATRDHGDPQHLLLASWDRGLLRSTDGGDSWSLTSLSGNPAQGSCVDVLQHPTDDQIWYAVFCSGPYGSFSGVYRSDDGGASFAKVTSPAFPPEPDWYRATLAVSFGSPDTVALRLSDGNALIGVARSSDAGLTWQDLTGELAGLGFGGTQAFHAGALAIHPEDPDTLYAGVVDMAVTNDAGADWMLGATEHSIAIGHSDSCQYLFSPLYATNVLFMCNDGGVYWADLDNETTYSMIGTSQSGLQITEVDFLDSDRGMTAIGTQDNGVAQRLAGTSTWTFLGGGDGGAVVITDPVAQSLWFAWGLWSINRKLLGSSVEGAAFPANPRAVLHHDPDTDRVFACEAEKVWARPADFSSGWSLVAENLQPGSYSIRGLSSDFGSRAATQTLYVTYWDEPRDLTLLRYDDGTGTWSPDHTDDWAPAHTAVETVHGSPEWPDVAWVGLKGGPSLPKLMRTTDDGATWEDVTGDLVAIEILSIATRPFEPSTIWVGTEMGVFRTTNGGQNWSPWVDGLPVVRCTELRFVVSDLHGPASTLVLGTDGRGTWTRVVPQAPIYYVDRNHVGVEDGTRERPYNTLTEALAVAVPGAIVAMKENAYAEAQRIDGNVRIVAWPGESQRQGQA